MTDRMIDRTGERRTMRTGAGRVFGAVLIATVVTAAVTVPMAYQAGSARNPAPAPAPPAVSEPAPAPEPQAPVDVAGISQDQNPLYQPVRDLRLVPAEDVVASDDGVDRGLEPLDGDVLPDRPVWIVVERDDAATVRFWLNDPDGRNEPDQIDLQAPFTLVSGPDVDAPAPVDPDQLEDGNNTVLVEITVVGGGVEYQRATFRIG